MKILVFDICFLLFLTVLHTNALKLLPAERTVIKQNGTTRTISRYVLLPHSESQTANAANDDNFSQFLQEFEIGDDQSESGPKKKVDRYRIYIKRKLRKGAGKSGPGIGFEESKEIHIIEQSSTPTNVKWLFALVSEVNPKITGWNSQDYSLDNGEDYKRKQVEAKAFYSTLVPNENQEYLVQNKEYIVYPEEGVSQKFGGQSSGSVNDWRVRYKVPSTIQPKQTSQEHNPFQISYYNPGQNSGRFPYTTRGYQQEESAGRQAQVNEDNEIIESPDSSPEISEIFENQTEHSKQNDEESNEIESVVSVDNNPIQANDGDYFDSLYQLINEKNKGDANVQDDQETDSNSNSQVNEETISRQGLINNEDDAAFKELLSAIHESPDNFFNDHVSKLKEQSEDYYNPGFVKQSNHWNQQYLDIQDEGKSGLDSAEQATSQSAESENQSDQSDLLDIINDNYKESQNLPEPNADDSVLSFLNDLSQSTDSSKPNSDEISADVFSADVSTEPPTYLDPNPIQSNDNSELPNVSSEIGRTGYNFSNDDTTKSGYNEKISQSKPNEERIFQFGNNLVPNPNFSDQSDFNILSILCPECYQKILNILIQSGQHVKSLSLVQLFNVLAQWQAQFEKQQQQQVPLSPDISQSITAFIKQLDNQQSKPAQPESDQRFKILEIILHGGDTSPKAIPNTQLFTLENLKKILDSLEFNTHVLSNRETSNFYKIIKLIFETAKTYGLNQNSGGNIPWYNQNQGKNPIQKYVSNLLQQSWLQDIVTHLSQNNYNPYVVQNPRWANYLLNWQTPVQLLKPNPVYNKNEFAFNFNVNSNFDLKPEEVNTILNALQKYLFYSQFEQKGSVNYNQRQKRILYKISLYLRRRGYSVAFIRSLIGRLYVILNTYGYPGQSNCRTG